MCEYYKHVDWQLCRALVDRQMNGHLMSHDEIDAFRDGWFAAKHAFEPHTRVGDEISSSES